MSNNPPGYYKNNALTRAMERVQEINAMHGIRAHGGGLPQGDVPALSGGMPAIIPTVQVYDPRNVPIGADDKPIPVVSNLDPEEQERRDREWANATGQRVGSAAEEDDDGIGGTYGTLDQATPVLRSPARSPRAVVGQYAAPPQFSTKPAIVNFKKLEGLNLTEGTAIIDGVGFKLDATWLRKLKADIAAAVVSAITLDMEESIAAPTEDVQPVQTGEASVELSPAQPEA
jgi:hypothetical protein